MEVEAVIGKAWAADPWGHRNYSEGAPRYAKYPDNSENFIYLYGLLQPAFGFFCELLVFCSTE
jgi:hypothetical protein